VGEDARQSLTALVTVSLVFGAFYFGLQLLKDVDLPRWLPPVGFGLNAVTLVWHLIARRRRRRRSAPAREQ
jgi:hypothetical protein